MQVNKTLAATAITIPLQFAHAYEPTINTQVASIDIEDFDPGVALVIGYEHPLGSTPNVSIEGEVTKSVVNPSRDSLSPLTLIKSSAELDFYTLSMQLKYTHPFTLKFSFYGRLGMHYQSITYDYDDGYFGYEFTTTDLGTNFGIGTNYQLTPSIELTAGINRYLPDASSFGSYDFRDSGFIPTPIDLFSVGAKFKL